MVDLDRYNTTCSTLDRLPDRSFIPKKTEDINLNVFWYDN